MIHLQEKKLEDTLINFDVVSLFTKIPLDEAIQVVKEVTYLETTNLQKFVFVPHSLAIKENFMNKQVA
jgi:hypothetical protein